MFQLSPISQTYKTILFFFSNHECTTFIYTSHIIIVLPICVIFFFLEKNAITVIKKSLVEQHTTHVISNNSRSIHDKHLNRKKNIFSKNMCVGMACSAF